MKKWVLKIGTEQTEYVCDLVLSIPDFNQLILALNGVEFVVNFHEWNDFVDAKDGYTKPVYITNKAKKKYRNGFAVFKIKKED